MDIILMVVAFGAIMYFLMIRPQQKRLKDHQNLISSLQPGSRVLLTSGMFASIRHVGERQMIVELAPGTEVTILKGNIARVATDDEEEFEFSDEADRVTEDDFSADALEPQDFGVEPNGPSVEEFDPRPQSDGVNTDDPRKTDN